MPTRYRSYVTLVLVNVLLLALRREVSHVVSTRKSRYLLSIKIKHPCISLNQIMESHKKEDGYQDYYKILKYLIPEIVFR